MRRFFIFPILMPLLGLPCITLATYLFSGQPKGLQSDDFLRGIGHAYWIGIIPAFMSAVADILLSASLPLILRAFAMLAVGYVATFVWVLTLSLFTMHAFTYALAISFIGMVPAAICSLLSASRLPTAPRYD